MDANSICWDYEKGDRGIDPEQTDREMGLYHHTSFVDPLFMEPEHDDFRLKETSPVFALGFIPWELKAGTITDFPLNRYS